MGVSLRPPPLRPEKGKTCHESLDKVKLMGPIGWRTGEAMEYSMRAFYDKPLQEKELLVEGIQDAGRLEVSARVRWLPDQGKLIIAFMGVTSEWDTIQNNVTCTHPSYLTHSLCRKARVHCYFKTAFESIVTPEEGNLGLQEAIEQLLDGERPVRVMCCGYALGGALASIAVVWLAMLFPTADLSCITFQSPRVGNDAFMKLFRWLVGTNYRLVHRNQGRMFTGSQALQHSDSGTGQSPSASSADHVTAEVPTPTHDDPSQRVYMCIIENAGMVSDLPYYGQVLLSLLDPEVIFQEHTAEAGTVSPQDGPYSPTAPIPEAAEDGDGVPVSNGEDLGDPKDPSAPAGQARAVNGVTNGEAAHTQMGHPSEANSPGSVSEYLQQGRETVGQVAGGVLQQVRERTGNLLAKPRGQESMPKKKQLRFAPPPGVLHVDALWQKHTDITVHQRRQDAKPEDSFKRTYTVEKVRLGSRSASNGRSSSISSSLASGFTSIHSKLASFGAGTAELLTVNSSRKDRGYKRSNTDGDAYGRSSPNGTDVESPVARSKSEPGGARLGNVDYMDDRKYEDEVALATTTGDGTLDEGSPRDSPGTASHDGQRHEGDKDAANGATGRQNRGFPSRIRRVSSGAHTNVGSVKKRPKLRPTCRGEARQLEVCRAALKGFNEGDAASDSDSSGSAKSLNSVLNNKMWPAAAFRRTPSNASALSEMDATETMETQDSQYARASSIPSSAGENTIEQEARGSLNQVDKVSELLLSSKVRQALLLSKAAYGKEEYFRERTGMKTARLVQDSKYDTQVYVGWMDPGIAVFAFRGTANARDATQDLKALRGQLDFLPGKFSGCRVHVGFMQQFNAVIDADNPHANIAEALKEISGGRTPMRVLCCGHSLGGALATLAAAWSALHYPTADIRCITFGSPRVGNRKFRTAFHALVGDSIRVVNGSDPIPTLPPPWKFTHVNNAVHFQAGNVIPVQFSGRAGLQLNVLDHYLNAYALVLYSVVPHELLTNQEHVEFGDVISMVLATRSGSSKAAANGNNCGCLALPGNLIRRSLSRSSPSQRNQDNDVPDDDVPDNVSEV